MPHTCNSGSPQCGEAEAFIGRDMGICFTAIIYKRGCALWLNLSLSSLPSNSLPLSHPMMFRPLPANPNLTSHMHAQRVRSLLAFIDKTKTPVCLWCVSLRWIGRGLSILPVIYVSCSRTWLSSYLVTSISVKLYVYCLVGGKGTL